MNSKAILVTNQDGNNVGLMDGCTISDPLVWYPRLLHWPAEPPSNRRTCGSGFGIHWQAIVMRLNHAIYKFLEIYRNSPHFSADHKIWDWPYNWLLGFSEMDRRRNV